MADYFNASTEALEMCRQHLQNIKDAQSNYQSKSSYVLGQDFDTVSNLVARLSDVIGRENAMVRWCAGRADERSSVVEMADEPRRSCSSSRRLTDELEEHVCLFIATVHRVRNLAIQEISKKA